MKKKILNYLDGNYESFSKSFKKIADYIKYNQSIISFISINQLAIETETSPATITRFSKNLGFKGYPDFQKIFQKEVEKETSYMKGLKNSIGDRYQYRASSGNGYSRIRKIFGSSCWMDKKQ